ncbi:PhzF family phenazine biosynthesis protein [Ferroacidibacillus organovorans]|uniref:PhzF family phenazine biosynthesis protein n=1 Tax=Ferroacidibacillus organovorans TaxID=1765683 RepID=UPI000AAE5FB9|nr:PhzF family phenazine biosynthesis protein [Ferroacidibacillus organovorans]
MTDFFCVDVFGVGPYTGNPLAVFLRGELYDDETMQLLAREMNLSETTFLMSDSITTMDGIPTVDVRIFTPVAEIPFAGHPTLGTAFVFQQEFLKQAYPTVNLRMKAGVIPVDMVYEDHRPQKLVMTQNQPIFGETFPSALIAAILSLKEEDIEDSTPIQMVSTGLPFLIVPLRHLDATNRARIHSATLEDAFREKELPNILIYTTETVHDHDYHVRVFVPELGVSEDPATGSANGCLCAYLSKYDTNRRGNYRAIVEQGYMIKRPSLLYLEGERNADQYVIRVGGGVTPVYRGTLMRS